MKITSVSINLNTHKIISQNTFKGNERISCDTFEINKAQETISAWQKLKNLFFPKKETHYKIEDAEFKLPKSVIFKKAENIEEAAKFAKDNFGIQEFNVQDINIANYVNKGMSILVNKTEGDIILPDIIEERPRRYAVQAVYIKKGKKVLCINPNVTEDRTLLEHNISPEYFRRLNYFEKLKVKNHYTQENQKHIQRSIFHDLFHEIGHFNHIYQNPEIFNSIISDSNTSDVYKVKKEDMFKIGAYAYMGKAEMVAEVYAYLMQGICIPREFIKLYLKYGGPKIPNVHLNFQ